MRLNQRVVLQVTMPALLVALSMLGTSLLGIRSINKLQADRDKIVSEHVRSLQAAQDLETELRHLRFHSFLYVMEMSSTERWAKVEKDQHEFERILAEIRSRAAPEEEQRVVQEIEAGYFRYREELAESIRTPIGSKKEDSLRWADAHPIRYIVVPCEQLLELNRKAMQETVEASASQSHAARVWMIFLGVMGAVGGLVGGFGMAWGLSRSMTRLSVQLQDVHAQLDREVGSLRLTAIGGDLQSMERQVGVILERVRAVVSQLQKQESDAIRAEQLAAIGRLAAGVAHEVRNPLTSIKLLVGAALNGRYEKGLTEADLHVIYDEVGRLERKVQALLDYARPMEMTFQTTAVQAIIRKATDLIEERLRQQSVNLSTNFPRESITAEFDPDQFQGVILNLIQNALDAMPQGGAINLELSADSKMVQLKVCDTGTGIKEEILEKLFTPFLSTKPTGTGLGLSVSRRIIQSHGGSLTAKNLETGGACFTLIIPVHQGVQHRADASRGG